ncbi:6304_t:CDS:2 [Paraglomus brasilianum]|uniref:6304_t:CDS:1 n=1 Tax=Paraglomus brasilianum TaxID=144538 RepID=A0A9N8VX70_9GLOM|nr:6304_t:CDS:2 [Paraglomus brasilianum]
MELETELVLEALDLIDLESAANVLAAAGITLAMSTWRFVGISSNPIHYVKASIARGISELLCHIWMFFAFWTTISRLMLAPTAEVPLAGSYSNRLLSESQLPIKMVGFGELFVPKQELEGMIRKDYREFIGLAK